MAKKKTKRKAPAKRRKKTPAKRRKAPKRDRFSQLTAAHAKATAAGDSTTAALIKRELTGKRRRKGRR